MPNLTTKRSSTLPSWNKVLCQLSNKLKSVSDNADFEAQEIASFVSGKSLAWIIAHGDDLASIQQQKQVASIVRRRLHGEALYYILGECDFCGLTITIDKNVLIPRPETELLIDEAIKYIRRHVDAQQCHPEQSEGSHEILPYVQNDRALIRIADIGTGSGAIAVAVGDYCTRNKIDAKITASDISKSALNVARKNIKKYQLGKSITLKRSNLLESIEDEFDIIVANLPYVETEKIDGLPDPQLALDGGKDGFDSIAKLLRQISDKKTLSRGGIALFEIGHNQEKQSRELALALFPTAKVDTIRDLAGYPRIGKIIL